MDGKVYDKGSDVEEILNGLRNGNEETYRIFIRAYEKPLFSFIMAIVRDYDEALDLIQEVFVRVLKNISGFKEECSLKTWLFKIAHNIALNHISSAYRRYHSHEDICDMNIADQNNPEMDLNRAQIGERLLLALKRLPSRQRAIVQLRIYDEMTFKEIADILTISEGGAKSNFFFALKNLKKILGTCYG